MANVQDIRRICQAGKDKDPGWYIIHRRLSIYITAFLVDTPISLNQVSLLMMAMAATGAVLLTVHSLWVNAIAGLCLYLSFLLDKVDGEMARYRGLQSPIGILLDRFHHRLFEPLIFLALGWREYQVTHSTTPLFAALATMLAANIVEEVQHLPAYIAAKHARETREWPASEVKPSPWLRRTAAVFRSLKTFRMFITVVPLALGVIVAGTVSAKPVITWYLLTSAVALWVYVVFQAFYYANGGLEEKMTELADQLPPLPPRLRTERPTPPPARTPTLSLVSSPRPPRPPGPSSGPAPGPAPGPAGQSWILLFACLALAGRAEAATYYVDNTTASCSNSGTGSINQPYCTISAALAARGVAGNTIMVKAGTYPETVTIPASGTSTNPLVLRGYGGTVTVDGADDFSSASKWTLVTGSVYRAASVTWSPFQVFSDGVRLTANSGNNVNTLPPLSFRYISGEGLYVNAGNGNPGNHALKVGRRTNAIVLSGKSWITIEGIGATRTEDRALNVMNGSNDVMFLGGDVTFANRYGVYVQNCSRFTIANCRLNDNNHHGIMLTGSNDCTIEFNEGARNLLPGTRNANGIHLTGSSRNLIRNNRWHDNQDTGQHLQSGSNDNISTNNLSWNNGDHGFDHLGALNTFHTNDVCYGNFKDGFSIEGGSTGTRLYNCVAADNGITTAEFNLWISNDSKTGLVSNDNLFYNSTSQNPIKYGSSQYGLVTLFALASGQDTRSLQLDPRFVDPLGGNFHPAADSPLIDNGNSSIANWPTNDADGNARVDDPATPDTGIGPFPFADRGALEFQTAGLPPVALLEAWPILGTAPVQVTLDASNSFDPDGSIVSYEFDFGDGVSTAPQAGPVAMHKYTAGTYHAIVEIVDDAGFHSRDTVVVIANAPPVAAMTATPLTGKAPLTVSFNAATSSDPDGGVASYLFDFGDGVTQGPQPGATATHVYGTGTWKARLRVADDRGGTDTLNTAITLSVGAPNVAPTCALSLNPTSGHAPLTVTADASGSSDADGSIASYKFTFADTLVVGPQPGASATAVLGAGMNHVKVQVTDNDGATSSFTDSLLVQPPVPDRAPVIQVAASVTIAEGGTLSLPVTASDPDGHAVLSLTASLLALPAGNDAAFTTAPDHLSGTLTWHPAFTHAGTYTVTFTASNALSGQASTQVVVTDWDRAPVVNAPAEVLGGGGQPVSFAVTASDPDGQAIGSLQANLTALPADNPGTFTPGANNTGGTFTWTPRAQDTGTFIVTVTASNALAGSRATSLRIGVSDTPPDVVAAATADASENAPFSLTVTASDPNGEAITSLTADLSGLPAGNNAVFTPAANKASGTLQWTPTFADSGHWVVRFLAGNTLADTATTVVHVHNVDRAPVVNAPPSAGGPAGSPLTFQVTAVDPDGDAVTSLAANLTNLPAGHNATFTLSGGASAGTFAWTPTTSQAGTYNVTFTAANALSAQAATPLVIGAPNQPPVAALSVTPTQGTAPLLVTMNGAGSSDPEGGALMYTFNFGDGTVVGPQSASSASHSFGVGNWTVRLTVSDPLGAVHLATATVAVTGFGPGMNFVGNPSFESNLSGWNAYQGGALLRVAGGYDGSGSMQVTGPATLTPFGMNDSPNWVTTTPAAGTRYRFSAWVRSASSAGAVKLQIREYQGGAKIGSSTLSAPVTLAWAWQLVTVDYLAQLAGTTLDFQVFDTPLAPGETFLVDNVSIHIVPAAGAAAIASGESAHDGAALTFGAWVTPSVLRTDAVLSFVTTRAGGVRVQLYDAAGRLVRDLLDDANVAPGMHRIALDGRSDRGDRLESGMYFYRVQAAERTALGKVVVAR